MAFELERLLYETEDFLRRGLGSSSRREAKKRRMRRKVEEAMRRLRRAGLILAFILAALLAWSMFAGGIDFLTWIVAIPTAFLFAFLSLFRGGKGRAEPADAAAAAQLPLGELAARAEEALLDRCGVLPGRALPAADAIMARLAELHSHLDALEPASALAGDARRLIGQHLPRLVDSYLDLPESGRRPGSESSRRFTESLGIVAGELDTLLETCCRDRQIDFDTQRRFIETRYQDDGGLNGM